MNFDMRELLRHVSQMRVEPGIFTLSPRRRNLNGGVVQKQRETIVRPRRATHINARPRRSGLHARSHTTFVKKTPPPPHQRQWHQKLAQTPTCQQDPPPPLTGTAFRSLVSSLVRLPPMAGPRPAMMATTVIIFGRTRSTAPSM